MSKPHDDDERRRAPTTRSTERSREKKRAALGRTSSVRRLRLASVMTSWRPHRRSMPLSSLNWSKYEKHESSPSESRDEVSKWIRRGSRGDTEDAEPSEAPSETW